MVLLRAFDKLLRSFQDPDPEIRRFVLHQMGSVPVDCDIDDVLTFLRQVAASEEPLTSNQARRTLRDLQPRAANQRYSVWQAPSTGSAGTWTEYNIDRSQIEKLKRLGQAQTRDFTKIPVEDFTAAGLYVLEPLIERIAGKLTQVSDMVVMEALSLLGLVPYPRDLDGMVQVASRSPSHMRAVAASLGEIGGEPALEKLLQLLETVKDPQLLGEVIVELRHFSQPAGYDFLIRSLEGAPTLVKTAVATALPSYDDPGRNDILVGMLHEGDRNVALWAMGAISRLGNAELMPEIELAFNEIEDVQFRRMAVRAAIQTRSRPGMEFVRKRISYPDPDVRAQIIEGLIRLDLSEKDLFAHVFPMVNDQSPQVVAHAILALAPIDVTLAHGKIRQLLGDPDPVNRAYGAWALGYVQSPNAMAMLRHTVFYDADELVSQTSVRALGKYPDLESSAQLLGVLKHQNPRVRLAAARRLGEIRAPDTCRKVFAHLGELCRQEPDVTVRASMFSSMARIGEPTQHLVVGRGLKDQAKDVVKAALEGLDLMGNIESISQFDAFLDDPRPDIKARASAALWHQGEMRVIKNLVTSIESLDDMQMMGAMRASGEILTTLRNLENTSKFLLLLSELESQMKKPGYQTFRSQVDRRRRAPGARMTADSFEFSTVVGKQAELELKSGEHKALANLPVNRIESTPSLPRASLQHPGTPTASPSPVVSPSTPFPPPPPLVMPQPPTPASTPAARPPELPPPAPVAASPSPQEPVDSDLDGDLNIHSGSGLFDGLSFGPPSRLDEEEELPQAPPDVTIERALRLGAQGNLGGARSLLATLPPTWDQTRDLVLASLLMQTGLGKERASARELLEQVVTRDGRALEARLALAQLIQRDGDQAGMLQVYLEAVDLGLEILEKMLRDARGLIIEGGWDHIGPLTKELNRHLPHLGQMSATMGEMAYRLGRYPEAFQTLYNTHLLDPANKSLSLLLARTAARSQRPALAREICQNLIDASDTPQDIVHKATKLLETL